MDKIDSQALDDILQEIINVEVKKDEIKSEDNSNPASSKEMPDNKIDTETCKKLEKMQENCLKLAEQNQKLIEENNELKEGFE